MTEPRPLNEEAPLTAAMVGRLAPVAAPTLPEAQRLWRAVQARRSGRRSAWRPVFAFASAAAVASALVFFVFRPAAVAFTAEPGAQLVAQSLVRGRVHGLPAQSLAQLSTPHAQLAWTNARFLLEVSGTRSVLWVEHGEVTWRPAGGAEQRVAAGVTVRSPEPAPVDLPQGFGEVQVAVSQQCAGARACLEQLAAGQGLAAQNALFELGRYRDYLARFPDGVLAPEASLAELSALVRARNYPAALAAARAHEARFPDPKVTALRLQLEQHEAFSR